MGKLAKKHEHKTKLEEREYPTLDTVHSLKPNKITTLHSIPEPNANSRPQSTHLPFFWVKILVLIPFLALSTPPAL